MSKFYEKVTEFEVALITEALDKTSGNIAQAARELGLNRTTLSEKMRKLGLKRFLTNFNLVTPEKALQALGKAKFKDGFDEKKFLEELGFTDAS